MIQQYITAILFIMASESTHTIEWVLEYLQEDITSKRLESWLFKTVLTI
jgi:hypothetical protein